MSTDFNKQIIWSFALFVLIFFSANTIFNLAKESIFKNNSSQYATVAYSTEHNRPVYQKSYLTVAFVGDLMLDRGVKKSVYKNFTGDYSQLFDKVKGQLKDYDLLIANLEGPVSDKGEDVGGIYSFRFETQVIPILKEVGFDIFSVANNHTFNWGREAFVDTLFRLTDENITYIGGGLNIKEAYQGKVINIKDLKIIFLAFSEFGPKATLDQPGLAMISETQIKESVSQARINNDLVIVSYHFGEEYQSTPNNFQRKYAELAIDSGADLVVGHHPHVIQALEQYKNTYIMYSLGNFIFDQYFSVETMRGGLLEVEINLESKQIEKVNLKKVLLNKFYQIEAIE